MQVLVISALVHIKFCLLWGHEMAARLANGIHLQPFFIRPAN